MTFATVPGLKGKVFVPQPTPGGAQKHPCAECFSCQGCSDDRCRVCLSQRKCRPHSLFIPKCKTPVE